jgi:hypothetical protein
MEYDTAECEFLTGRYGGGKSLLMLAQCAKPAHDIALVIRLRVTLCTALDQGDRAVEVSVEYLRSRGTDLSPHPTRDKVAREYDRIWSQLGSRKIEELIDLPLMTNSDILNTMDVLSEIIAPATGSVHWKKHRFRRDKALSRRPSCIIAAGLYEASSIPSFSRAIFNSSSRWLLGYESGNEHQGMVTVQVQRFVHVVVCLNRIALRIPIGDEFAVRESCGESCDRLFHQH